jgi:hypothetical protein
MKTLSLSVFLVLLGSASGDSQEAEKAVPNPASTEKKLFDETKVTQPPETLTSLKLTGLTYDQNAVSDFIVADLIINTNIPLETVPTNTLTTIELERVQIHGTVTPAIKKRTFGSVLQLFNPFAPAEYGGTEPSAGEAGFSRVFHDPVKDGPTAVLFGVDRKTKKILADSEE